MSAKILPWMAQWKIKQKKKIDVLWTSLLCRDLSCFLFVMLIDRKCYCKRSTVPRWAWQLHIGIQDTHTTSCSCSAVEMITWWHRFACSHWTEQSQHVIVNSTTEFHDNWHYMFCLLGCCFYTIVISPPRLPPLSSKEQNNPSPRSIYVLLIGNSEV